MEENERTERPLLSRPELPIGIAILIVVITLVFAPSERKPSTTAVVTEPAASPATTTKPVPSEPPSSTASAAPPSTPLWADAGDEAPDAGLEVRDTPVSAATTRSFAAAKALFDAGRYADAIPKFEALASAHPEAELYAARSLVQMKSCYAAAPRYDALAARNAGTERGSRAALELARCYRDQGVRDAAQKRYEKLIGDPYVGEQAKLDLEKMNAPTRATRPVRPPAASTPAASTPPPPND